MKATQPTCHPPVSGNTQTASSSCVSSSCVSSLCVSSLLSISKHLNSVTLIHLCLPQEQQSTVIILQTKLFLFPSHTLACTLTCTHTYVHTLRSEDQRLIMSFHQLHHPLFYLSSSCLIVVFMCVLSCVHMSARLSAAVGTFFLPSS